MARVLSLLAVLAATLAAVSATTTVEVGLKVLVLGVVPAGDATLSAITTALTARGTPFDYVNVLDGYQNGEELPLVDAATGRGNYYAIVKTSRDLAYEAAPGNWPSALSNVQWQQIKDYQYTYKVRAMSLHSWPFFNGATYHSSGATAFMQYTLEHQQLDAGVKENMRVDLVGSYVTPANLDNAPTFTATSFLYASDDLSDLPNGVGSAIHVDPVRGEETWHFFFIPTPYYPGQVAALQLAVNWVTRGIFLGKRRLYLGMQIDDLFLWTGEWEPEHADNDDNRDQVRCTPADMEALKAYQENASQQLPEGSFIRYEFAYNGEGVVENGGYGSDPLSLKAKELDTDFWYITHTYTHPFLDEFSYGACRKELSDNWDAGKRVFGDPLPEAVSQSAMVNPAITGLFNPACLRAMIDEGIVTAVGDNSRTELIPENLWHGLRTTVDHNGYEGVFIIPRWATNIFYDNSLPDLNLVHFNAITPYTWTWEQLMDYEGRTAARNLLMYRPDPYMFHQANIHTFDFPGWTTKTSLLALWTQSVIDHLNKYNAFPVISLREDDMRVQLEERMARDACGIDAYQVVENGVPTRVHATSTGECKLALSGIPGSQLMESETYGVQWGGERTVYAAMKPGEEVVIDTGLNPGPTCPIVNGAMCAGKGTCDASANPPVCLCTAGWSGEDCTTQVFGWGESILGNGDFAQGTTTATLWGSFGTGYTVGSESGNRYLSMSPGAANAGGAYQFLTVGQQYATALRISGRSKATGVSGVKDGNYAVYVDAVYADGSWQYGLAAKFATGTHDWEAAEVTFTPTKPVAFLWVYCMFRYHDGTALFDDIKVEQEVPLPATTGEPTPDGRCGANSPTNAGCPAASPCCSTHGWCGSGSGHCTYDEAAATGGTSTPGGEECATCTTGTSGPCKHPDGWCTSLDSANACPTGTVSCDSASALSTSSSAVVVNLDVAGIEADAFTPSLTSTFEASFAKSLQLPAGNVKVSYVDKLFSSDGSQKAGLQVVVVGSDGAGSQTLADAVDAAVSTGTLESQLAADHMGVQPSLQGKSRVSGGGSSGGIAGLGGVGIAMMVGIAAVAVVLGVAVGAVAMRRRGGGSASSGNAGAPWVRDRTLTRVNSHSSLSSAGGAFMNVGLNRNTPAQSRRASVDGSASDVSEVMSGADIRRASHRQMVYNQRPAAIHTNASAEPELFGTVTPRKPEAAAAPWAGSNA